MFWLIMLFTLQPRLLRQYNDMANEMVNTVIVIYTGYNFTLMKSESGGTEKMSLSEFVVFCYARVCIRVIDMCLPISNTVNHMEASNSHTALWTVAALFFILHLAFDTNQRMMNTR